MLEISTAHLLVGVLVFLLYLKPRKGSPDLSHIPTVGPSGPLGMFPYILGMIKFQLGGSLDMVQQGCEQYKNGVFKVATIHHWVVIAHGRARIEEARQAPEDHLSHLEEVNDHLQTEFTMGRNVMENTYHIAVIKNQLTRNLAALFSDIREEVSQGLEDALDLQGNAWKSIHAQKAIQSVVARAVDRLLVGLPLCRDRDLNDLSINFTIDVVKAAEFLRLFPRSLRPLLKQLCTNVPNSFQRGVNLLRPVIEERMQNMAQYGVDYPGKPNDCLSWLIDEADANELTVERLTSRLLTLTFAAMHTTSMTFLHVLYDFAARPEVADVLREELVEVTRKYGFTKVAMAKLVKMDSFIKETYRTSASASMVMGRKALKPFTFTDGTYIPQGTFLFVALKATHTDPEIYGPDAGEFKPFRFACDPRSHTVATSLDYLIFGHGPRACPGRFFAVNEIKILFSEILMNYEVKFEDGKRPDNLVFGPNAIPNPKAHVMYRRRVE